MRESYIQNAMADNEAGIGIRIDKVAYFVIYRKLEICLLKV